VTSTKTLGLVAILVVLILISVFFLLPSNFDVIFGNGHFWDGKPQGGDPGDIEKKEIDNEVFALLGYGMGAGMVEPLKSNLENNVIGSGTDWIRTRWIIWNEIEPHNGEYDWSLVDYYLAQDSLNMVFNLESYSSWGSADPSSLCGQPLGPASVSDYEEYIFDLVTRSKDKVKYWQVGNEPDNLQYWCCPSCSGDQESGEEFVELLRITHNKIKEADPDAVVVLGGFTGAFVNGEPIKPELVKEVLVSGKDYFDILDVHLYEEYGDFGWKLQWFKDEMSRNGYSKPVWSTEMGGPDIRNCLSPAEQAAIWDIFQNPEDYTDPYEALEAILEANECAKVFYFSEYNSEYYKLHAEELVKRYAHRLDAEISKTFWFNLYARQSMKNPPYLQVLIFERMGLVAVDFFRLGSLTEDDYFMTPAYYTYKLMSGRLQSLESVNSIGLEEGVSAFQFTVNREPVFILWSDSDATVDLSSRVSSDSVKVTHIVTELDSNNEPVYPADEVVQTDSVSVGLTPIFVESV